MRILNKQQFFTVKGMRKSNYTKIILSEKRLLEILRSAKLHIALTYSYKFKFLEQIIPRSADVLGGRRATHDVPACWEIADFCPTSNEVIA